MVEALKESQTVLSRSTMQSFGRLVAACTMLSTDVTDAHVDHVDDIAFWTPGSSWRLTGSRD